MKSIFNGKIFMAIFMIVLFGFNFVLCENWQVQKVVALDNEMPHQSSIPIAMAADDNYTYPTIVSITSLVKNSGKNTCYDVYIMVPGKF